MATEVEDKVFLKFYFSLPEKSATTIRFFDRGEFYTVHGADAISAAQDVFKSESRVRYIGKEKLESLSLSKINFELSVRDLLLVKHLRVEVYRSLARNTEWELAYKASPGNLGQFEDILFANNEMSTRAGVLAVKVVSEDGTKRIATALVEQISQEIFVCEFVDDDHYSNFESLMVQLSPKEVLIGEADATLVKVIERHGCLLSQRKKGEFNDKNIEQDIVRLLKPADDAPVTAASITELKLLHAMSCLAAIIVYLELMSDESNFAHFVISRFNMKEHMKLDSAAVASLNLLPTTQQGGNKCHSVLGLLNHCRTAQGQRLLSQWVKQPLLSEARLNERYDLVEALMSCTELRQSLFQDLLKGVPDFLRLSKKVLRKRADLRDCYRLYAAIKKLPELVDCLDRFDSSEMKHSNIVKQVFVHPLNELLVDFGKYEEMIESTVDAEKIESCGEFLVKSDFDEELQEMRVKMDELELKFDNLLKKAASDLGLEAGKGVKLENNSQLGYFFRVTRKDEKVLRNSRLYHTIDTNKSGVRFRNTMMRQLNDEYTELREQYFEQQKQIVDEIVGIALGYVDTMVRVNDIVAHLDVCVSLACAACNARTEFVRPKLLPMGSGRLKLQQVRHPCLEMQDNVEYIPNDVHFDSSSYLFHIITGPNMGGKSTYIRSVGVSVLLAQIGSFVPCDSAEISIVDSILCRVGASDDQLRGVSTFMAEMLDSATILRAATANSLVIIDELGRGTSTYDGFGLAWAIAHHIAMNIKPFCMFATHYYELTSLAEEVPLVNNLHVSALTSTEELTYLFRVKQGICDQSFGIHVAKLANFPSDVIMAAKRKAAEFEDFQSADLTGTELHGDSEMAAKKKIASKREAQELIEEFLEKAKQLASEKLEKPKLTEELVKMKNNIFEKNNVYVNHLLQKCGYHD